MKKTLELRSDKTPTLADVAAFVAATVDMGIPSTARVDAYSMTDSKTFGRVTVEWDGPDASDDLMASDEAAGVTPKAA